MPRSIKLLIEDILEEIFFLERNSNINEIEFLDNELLQRAFVRSLEVIGEATKKIPISIKEQYPKIQWREMAGIRDILINDYSGIDYSIVWNVVEEYIPLLKEKLTKIEIDE